MFVVECRIDLRLIHIHLTEVCEVISFYKYTVLSLISFCHIDFFNAKRDICRLKWIFLIPDILLAVKHIILQCLHILLVIFRALPGLVKTVHDPVFDVQLGEDIGTELISFDHTVLLFQSHYPR